jgi:hypothetical protein
MTPINKILAGVLGLQLLAAAAVWMPRDPGVAPPRTLVALKAAEVTQIQVTGRTTPDLKDPPKPVVLEKRGEQWVLPSLGGYPADPTKVDELLAHFAEVQVRSPVATTPASHVALNVAEDQFTRRVEWSTPAGSTTLWVGAGQGQTAHLRKSGESEVFSTRAFTAWSLADQDRRYFDTQYIKVELDDLSSFSLRNAQGDYTLLRAEGAWTPPAGFALTEPAEADALARSLLNVRLHEPVGQEVKPEYGLDGSVRVSWTQGSGDQSAARSYVVGAKADSYRYVKADDSPWVVKVTESTIVRSVESDFKFLVAAPE